MDRQNEVWKSAALVRTFLDGVRGGIPFAAEQIEMMLRVVAARGTPVARFADLGCGSGVLARALLTQYPRAQSALVDFSEPMLDAARAQLGDHDPRPHFVTADLGTRAWVDGVAEHAPFDAIVSGYAIHHLPDQRKRELYGEIFALLEPGGMFINIEHVASHTPWIEAVSDELMIHSLHRFHAQQGGFKTREQIADEYVHRPDKAANILVPVETQCEWLRDCGFEDADCYFKALELAVFGGRRPAAAVSGRRRERIPPETICTERLVLRVPRLDDAGVIFDGYAQDAEVTRYLTWRPSRQVAETVAHLQENLAAWRAGDRFAWVITRRADGAVIGAIELRLEGHAACLGYVLARAEWGKGYMTEAVRTVIDTAFSLPHVYRVWALCDVDNLASARVLEKAGMLREGRLQRCVVHPNLSDTPRDAYCYAKTQ